MNEIVENWEVIAEDFLEEGYKIEEIVVIVGRSFNLFYGLLTKALIQAGKIPADTVILDMDKAAFVK